MNSLKITRNHGLKALPALLLLTLISGCSTTPRTVDGNPPETPRPASKR
jgi:uncharacterized lipoprotein YajG